MPGVTRTLSRRELLLLPVLSPAIAFAQASSISIAVRGVTVIDGTGSVQPDHAVLISGNRIASIGPTGRVEIPKRAKVIDGRGRYLMPGLWDMHVHLSYTKASALPALLANGVTGVRDCGGLLREIDEWRVRVLDGRLAGPRIYRAGPTVNGQAFDFHQLAVANAAEARIAVRALHKAGVDFIKTHRAISKEAYYAVAETTKSLGLRFCGHIPRVFTPEEASDAGQLSFEHAITLFETPAFAGIAEADLPNAITRFRTSSGPELFARLVRNGTWVDPTLVSSLSLIRFANPQPRPQDRYVSQNAKRLSAALRIKYKDALTPQMAAIWENVLDALKQVVGDMNRAGVGLLTGTDLAADVTYPGFDVHDELELLVESGLSPAQALQTATRNPARALGLPDLGTVERGKIADLVLLDADPLLDIRNTRRIRAVFFAGRLFERPDLDQLLRQSAAEAAKPLPAEP